MRSLRVAKKHPGVARVLVRGWFDSRTVAVDVAPRQAFTPIRRLGGKTGWYYGNWLWRIRGFLDLLVGGVGVRRGRRHPNNLRPGDALDFWRVERYEPDHLLRLRAEMKVPGRAWLEFEVTPNARGSKIRQTAIFDPLGLFGLAYWYSLYPLHQFVFAGMLRNIARASEDKNEAAGESQTSNDKVKRRQSYRCIWLTATHFRARARVRDFGNSRLAAHQVAYDQRKW